jgi:DNA-binding transcriptional ArsR family regulator
MIDIEVITDPAAAAVALDPIRSQLLAELAKPASAAALATRMGLARQKVNYHVRALEACNLVKVAERRHWGGLTERLLVSCAKSFVVSPEALGPAGADPARSKDRLAASYLIALGARIVREVGDLWRRARQADKHLATLSIDAEIRFASPADRAAFTRDFTQAVTELASRYHDATASTGRSHRLIVVSHPLPVASRAKGTVNAS